MATFSLTVNASKVAATLTDYPAYVDLSEMPAAFWAEVTNGGGDIRCYSDSGLTTELAREIVSCDTVTDTGEMHVKVPSLTTSSVIYVTVDGTSTEPAVGATYGRNAVWSDYGLVYHFQEASGNVIDSTGNGNDGVVDAGVIRQATGAIGFAHDYDFSEKTTITNDNTISASAPSKTDFTISGWFNPDNVTSSSSYPAIMVSNWVINARTAGWTFGPWGGDVTGGSPTNGVWTHLFGYHNNPGTYLRIDGTQVAGVGAAINGASGSLDAALAFRLGTTLSWDGQIAEFRFRKSALNSDWGSTEYNNQSDVTTFWTIAEEGGGGGVTKNAVFFGGGM